METTVIWRSIERENDGISVVVRDHNFARSVAHKRKNKYSMSTKKNTF